MARRAAAATAAALALVAALPGCLAPFHAHIDPAVVQADLDWSVSECPRSPPPAPPSCNGRRHEVDYIYQGNPGPPYSAVLQVISIREVGRRSTEDLLALVAQAVETTMEQKGIRPDDRAPVHGERTLQNGLRTQYFIRNGTAETATTLFRDSVRVRIIGEVGYDGRSATSVVLVGIAQTEAQQCTGPAILPNCRTTRDVRSWVSMVGDPRGSIDGAFELDGLIYHLVSHG